MPVVNTVQARIELSEFQYLNLSVLLNVATVQADRPPMIYLEETNLTNVIAIGSKYGFCLMEHNGDYRHISTSERLFTGERVKR